MWRLTWAQMRRNVGKLIAVGIAIALGTGFIAATFVTTNAIEETALASARASVGDPDVVLQDSSYSLTDADLAALEATDGVAGVHAPANVFREVTTPEGTEVLVIDAPASDPRLSTVTLSEGSMPAGAGEIAVPAVTAERLGVSVGDTVTVVSEIWTPDAVTPERVSQESTLVGLLTSGTGLGFGMPLAVASATDVAAWQEATGGATYRTVTMTAEPGTAPASLLDAVAAAHPGDSITVLTGEQYSREVAASFTGGIQIFRALILAFAAVAMAVAGIVIANTFTVLVAQRTRTLALLRCVGATQKQVKRSVRLEALVLGVVASVAGIALGLGIGQAALSIIAARVDGVPAPTTVPVDLATILVPLIAGVVVTVVSASGAARLATSVAPLAALRPVDAVVSARSSRARKVIGWVLTGGGLALMGGALALSQQDGRMFEIALGLGVLGGMISIIGVVMAAITIVPAVSRLLGRAVSGLGVSQRLAATNAVRNPRRTTSTATALLVGVALVTMMSTGAAMTRSALTDELDAQFAIDVVVSGEVISPATIDAVSAVDGVDHAVLIEGGQAEVQTPNGPAIATVMVVDPATIGDVLATAPDTWERGTVLADGYLLSQDGPLTVGGTELQGRLTEGLPDTTVFLAAEEASGLEYDYPQQALLLGLADGADPVAVASAVSDAVSDTATGATAAPSVDGGAIQKAGFTQVLDTLLAVVVGLLGVAVVIALIGVANTLSLSVVERRRENALLRALGLTRRQLRGTLAVEGVLLAAVGALVGLVLGLVYGWIGGLLMLGPTTGLGLGAISVPWSAIGAVLAVAVLAGVLASVLPARGAVKVPPVAALAAE